jgi:hypothetical protein
MDEITYGFLSLFVLLQIADGLTTYQIVVRMKGTELNPVLRTVFDLVGVVPGLVVFKGAMICFFAYFHTEIPVWLWLVVTGLYAWVINHNIKQIKNHK